MVNEYLIKISAKAVVTVSMDGESKKDALEKIMEHALVDDNLDHLGPEFEIKELFLSTAKAEKIEY